MGNWENAVPVVNVRFIEPVSTAIQSHYGKPDGASHNISTMTGYIQPATCHLKSNGLALSIVQEAERIALGGFHVLS